MKDKKKMLLGKVEPEFIEQTGNAPHVRSIEIDSAKAIRI